MADVAGRAQVSAQTVSRVSNGMRNVDGETRERVLRAMRELGYRPNSAARALRTGRFHSIGVIMFTLSSFGNMRTLDAIAVAAAEAGYSITLIPVSHPTQGEVSGAFHRLGEEAVDGVVIIVEAHLIDETDVVLPPDLPVVVIDSAGGDKYPVVDTDQVSGARQAVEHLLELGHTTVWHIAGPPNSYSAHRRKVSWEQTLTEHHAPVPPPLLGDWTSASGVLAGARLAALPEVTAIFAANDQMALGVINALHTAGRRVPEDVSVVGFDDLAESAAFWPPLTTIRQDFALVGETAIRVLLSAVERRPVGPMDLVPAELIIRESTAQPPTLGG
ncbi:LacI family DNA-binding transcriptional regulator [Microbacteriaceae bacterium VKM Ac-2855]|nr:LacI family DNA-binding transcriptional regulator [Microbacteriaceae bacterium VKM Ac-2855]